MVHPSMSRQNLLGALSLRTKNIIADTELHSTLWSKRSLSLSLTPHSLSSLQRACNSNLCLTLWQLFFFFSSWSFLSWIWKCLFPQLWHPSKSGSCLSFPWIETLLSFLYSSPLVLLLQNLQSPSPLLLRVHELTMEHTSLWPETRQCQYWPWTVLCLLCVTSDLAQEPQAAKMTDISHTILLKYCVEPPHNKIFLEDCLQEQTVK